MPDLTGKVAVVSGASRGAGRGIALALSEAGATVYVTGRSRRGSATTEQRTETVDDTADQIRARGGTAVVVSCDHTSEHDVRALFAQVQQEQGRLDLLVNNAWSGYEGYDNTFDVPFWQQPLERLDRMLTGGVRVHVLTSYLAVPLMLPQRSGLIINTTAWDRDVYLGSLFYDVAKAAINRAALGMAQELREYGIAAVALAPGFMRTERVLEAFQATEQTWQSIEALQHTETPWYIGRAVVALAADPQRMQKSGQTLAVGDLAPEYGFTDIDGRQPPPFHIDA